MLPEVVPAGPKGLTEVRQPRHLRVAPSFDGRTALGIVGRAPAVGAATPVRDRRPGAPGWEELARCTGRSALFFPAADERWDEAQERERAAQQLCASCPVARECLAAGFASGDGVGVWGGTTPTQRVLLLIRDPESALVASPVPHPSL